MHIHIENYIYYAIALLTVNVQSSRPPNTFKCIIYCRFFFICNLIIEFKIVAFMLFVSMCVQSIRSFRFASFLFFLFHSICQLNVKYRPYIGLKNSYTKCSLALWWPMTIQKAVLYLVLCSAQHSMLNM